MIHRPEDGGRTPVILSALLLTMAAAGYLAGLAAVRFSWIFQLVTMAGLVGALYTFLRWHMTWFVYVIRGKHETIDPALYTGDPVYADGFRADRLPPEALDFAVIRGQGRKNGVMEALLGLETLVEAIPVTRRKGGDMPAKACAAEKYPGVRLYTYTRNLGWQEGMLLVFQDGPGYVALLLELPWNSPMGVYLCQRGSSR